MWPAKLVNEEVRDAINDSVLLGGQRTATQDVQFIFEQMVEMTVRSLSPGINDPFTAIICIDHPGQGLRRMAGRHIPSPFRLAEDGSLRVIADPITFAELVDTALSQIRHYGRAPVLGRLFRHHSGRCPTYHKGRGPAGAAASCPADQGGGG